MLRPEIKDISSADNPSVKLVRKLSSDNQAYRKCGAVWLEGDHLCRAYLLRRLQKERGREQGKQQGEEQGREQSEMLQLFFAQSYEANFFGWWREFAESAQSVVQLHRLPDALMRSLSGLDSPSPVGMLMDFVPLDATALSAASWVKTVVLDRLQDPGNVGSILRTAAALGYERIVALKGTAALWSPKVLRAGMGAHFALDLLEGLALEDLLALAWPLVVTSSHWGDLLHEVVLPQDAVWVFGHEGQGVAPQIETASQYQVRIAQPGGEESLNVAAAAAICLYSHVVKP